MSRPTGNEDAIGGFGGIMAGCSNISKGESDDIHQSVKASSGHQQIRTHLLTVCVYAYLYVYLSVLVYLCVYLPVFLCAFMRVFCAYLCLCISVCAYLCVYLHMCVSVFFYI